MNNCTRNVTGEIPSGSDHNRLYGFGMATLLLVGLAMGGDAERDDSPKETRSLRPTGRVLLDVNLDAPADIGFTIPEEISEELWMDAWGVPHIPDGSAIVLEGGYAGSSFQANLVEDFSAQGTYEEVSSIETMYLDVDISGQPEVALFNRRFTVGTLTGSTGYQTAMYGFVAHVMLESPDAETSELVNVKILVPCGVSDSLPEAGQAVMALYEVFASLGDSSPPAPPTPGVSCEDKCKAKFDLDLEAAQSDLESCLLDVVGQGIIAMGGCALLGPAGLPCAVLVTAGTIAREAACAKAGKADRIKAKKDRLTCLAGCPDSTVRVYGFEARVSLPAL